MAKKKYLKFVKEDGSTAHGSYSVNNLEEEWLGSVHPKGDLFKNQPVFVDGDLVEWTADCLYQLADFVKSFETK